MASDSRKLKDEVADYLKKQKWEKAADVLEKLVKLEPKDMSHRLKLGDAYRRMEQVQKAIAQYQHAARVFGDEGQLIKAIGAVKVVLELDPQNADAQKQLGEMNKMRFGRVTLESAGLARTVGIGAGARATSELELSQAALAAHEVARAIVLETGVQELEPGDDDEPLELDDGRPSRAPARPVVARRPSAPPAEPRTPPLSKQRSSFDLEAADLDLVPAGQPPSPPAKAPPSNPPALARKPPAPIKPPPPPAAVEIELDAPAPLPDSAILTPQPEDLAVPESDEVLDLDPAIEAPPARPAASPAVIVSEEIAIESPAAQPIADLLSSSAEEEIELLSISSDDEAAGSRPFGGERTGPDEADLDRAFGQLSPQATPAAKKPPPKKVPLFDDMPQAAFVELVNKLAYHRHVPGQLIIREGDPGRSFYVIVEGKVRIYKDLGDGRELTLAHLSEGAFFGEMALLSGAPRTANVVAEDDTEILEVSDVVLRGLAAKYPQVVASLKNFYRQRLLNNVMAISPLFKDFDPAERKAIVEKFRMKQAAPGDVLITEGKNSDGLYVVLHGAVTVAAQKDGAQVELARLKEGEIFGEMSLLTRKPATATVSAALNTILLRLPRENFQELVLTHPQILELVSELTEKRKGATEAILHGQGPGHDGMSFV